MAYDILILGGGPAGLSAALNARARGRSALVVSTPLEENPLWQAEKVDNHLGMPSLSGAQLLTAMRRHAEHAGAAFLEGRAVSAMRLEGTWYVSVGTEMENAKAMVLASGILRGKKFPGEAEFLGRGVSYCATCDGMLYRGKSVVVAGYSDSARREADFLAQIGCHVTYFHRPESLVIQGGNQVERVIVGGESVEAQGVFLLRSAMAPTDLFPGISMEGNFVKVDRKMATNLPGLFAAGDCTGGPLQVSKAVGEGLIAGQSAAAFAAALMRKK